ncbi:hypothetical protein ACFLU1_00975 [Chloroflexota bacterium]
MGRKIVCMVVSGLMALSLVMAACGQTEVLEKAGGGGEGGVKKEKEVVDEFRNNASRILSEERIEELTTSILKLEQIEDVSQLLRLTGI